MITNIVNRHNQPAKTSMPNLIKIGLVVATSVLFVGCSTTNSIPYKASTSNVITLQNTLKQSNTKVNLGTFALGAGVTEELMCRLMGPVKVAPGKTLSTYIKEAFQEELFLAQAYDTWHSPKTLDTFHSAV